MLMYLLVQGSAHHCFAVAQNHCLLGSAILSVNSMLSVLMLGQADSEIPGQNPVDAVLSTSTFFFPPIIPTILSLTL